MMNKNLLLKEILKREKKLKGFQVKIDAIIEEKNKVQFELLELEKVQKKLEALEADTQKKKAQIEESFQKLLEKQEEKSENMATDTHYKVGKAIRKVIEKLGGTMPEDLLTPDKSLKELEKEKQKNLE